MKQKTCLLVGVTDKKGSTNIAMKAALEQLGQNVTVFNYRTVESSYIKNPNSLLRKFLEKLTSRLRRYPLGPLKRLYFYFPSRIKMNNNLLNLAKSTSFDWILLCKTDTIDWKTVKKLSKKTKTFYFFMDPPNTANEIQAHKYAQNSTATSATFSKVYQKFKKYNPNSHWIIEGEDTTLFKQNKNETKTIDIIFAGSRDHKRHKIISEIKRHNIQIKWIGDGADHPAVYEEALVNLYQKSKIVLHINREGDGFSNRIIQALSCGSFCLTEQAEDIKKIFCKEKHLDWFNSSQSCIEQIKHYLKNANNREKIAKTGCKFVQENYTWTHQIQKIITLINKKS